MDVWGCNMNFKQLNAFREVMVTGSVSAAARNLHRTQPAISSQISGLEDEIGIKLFNRRDGRLQPVPEAHFLFAEATEILDRLDMSKQTLQSIRKLERGSIDIVSMPGPSVFLLPELISEFVTGRDEITVSLISRSSFLVQQLLSAQRYDVGLADMAVDTKVESALVHHDLMRFPCFCALPADDPLAQKQVISAADLNGLPLATLYDDHPTYQQLRRIFDDENLHLNRRFETQYFVPLLTFVERRLAYAIVDPLSVESYRIYRRESGTLVFRPFVPTITFAMSIVTPAHRPLSNLAQAFISMMKGEFQRIQRELS